MAVEGQLACNVGDLAHHVLAALHEALVDNLAGVVLARLDVDRLLHDGIRAAAERLARPVLRTDNE